jgi:hypothetical protein
LSCTGFSLAAEISIKATTAVMLAIKADRTITSSEKPAAAGEFSANQVMPDFNQAGDR